MTPLAVTLLALALLAAPLVGEAQPAGKVYRIGMLETRSTVLNAANIDAFRQGLRELGYKEGQNLEIEYRSSDGRDERFPGLASALVGLKVDVILTRGTPAALAAKSATRTIPVVMAASGDPACITERPPLLTESSKAPNPPTSPSSSPRSSSW
jgi:putative ABC transport system substrate-binding protein